MFKMAKRFCPKCKSENVRKELNVLLVAGVPQNWICENCGFHNFEFPIKEKLNKNLKLKC